MYFKAMLTKNHHIYYDFTKALDRGIPVAENIIIKWVIKRRNSVSDCIFTLEVISILYFLISALLVFSFVAKSCNHSFAPPARCNYLNRVNKKAPDFTLKLFLVRERRGSNPRSPAWQASAITSFATPTSVDYFAENTGVCQQVFIKGWRKFYWIYNSMYWNNLVIYLRNIL